MYLRTGLRNQSLNRGDRAKSDYHFPEYLEEAMKVNHLWLSSLTLQDHVRLREQACLQCTILFARKRH